MGSLSSLRAIASGEEKVGSGEALDITFATNSLAANMPEMWTEEEYSGQGETQREISKRRKREDRALPFDYDAEDDEM